MRFKSLLAALAVLAAVVVALPQPASAGLFRHRHHESGERVVTHRIYRPRYRHRYVGDPYRYRYQKRRYYPAYNSHYWIPARCYRKKCRRHYHLPPYYKAWGYTKRGHKRRHHRRSDRRHRHLW